MLFKFDNSYARLPREFYARVELSPVRSPTMIRLNRELAEHLGVDVQRLASAHGLAVLSGNTLAAGSEPIAQAYSGHQFGGFSPQLGDGRAMLLGEVIDKQGVRFDIQLKGSGPTPFSRRGDGRSALGPVLREYIVSEAMAAMGVPSTRALAAVATGEHVFRSGLAAGGVFARVARSHVRIGTFEWFAARRDDENLKVLADYCIERHYPEVQQADNPYLGLLAAVIERQAKLIAHWMQLGFIHGVMNTDNMTISGETIDYGPCAFMDAYHPAKVFSSIDHGGRYAFANQSHVAHWNLTRFAETLLPLIDEDSQRAIEKAESELGAFAEIHRAELQRRFLAKIGIDQSDDPSDWTLVESLLEIMAGSAADFTLVFRHLSTGLRSGDATPITSLFADPAAIGAWVNRWRTRIRDTDKAIELMGRTNPVYIPRNHRVEQAIAAGYAGDFQPLDQLCDVLARPFNEQAESARYERAPEADEVVQATFCGT